MDDKEKESFRDQSDLQTEHSAKNSAIAQQIARLAQAEDDVDLRTLLPYIEAAKRNSDIFDTDMTLSKFDKGEARGLHGSILDEGFREQFFKRYFPGYNTQKNLDLLNIDSLKNIPRGRGGFIVSAMTEKKGEVKVKTESVKDRIRRK